MMLSPFFEGKYQQEVRREILRLLVIVKRGLVIPFVVVGSVAALLWDSVAIQGLLFWAGIMCVISLIRIWSLFLNVESFDSKQVDTHLTRYAWLTNAYGLGWGLGISIFIPELSFEYQLFLIVVIACISLAMVQQTCSKLFIATYFYMFVPPLISFVVQFQSQQLALALSVGLFLIAIVIVSIRQFYVFSDSISMRFENNQLIADLKAEITKHQQTARELENAKQLAEQSSEAKTEFLAVMSHELRTPIHGIIGTLDVLSEAPLNEEHREFLMLAQQASLSLSSIVNDVLDLAKLNVGKMELHSRPFRVKDMIHEVMQTFVIRAKFKALALGYTIQEVPDCMVSDDIRLRQSLLNIIGNAVKFTEQGSVHVSLSRADHGLNVMVSDTGIGIPADEIDSIFDPFKQAQNHADAECEGTGLGTSIALRFIELLGGSVDVESQVGRGSTFTIYVPCDFQGEDVCCEVNVLEMNLEQSV